MDKERLSELTVRLLENHYKTIVARRDGIKACIEMIAEDHAHNDVYDRALRVGNTNEDFIMAGLDLLLAVAEQEVADAEAAIALHRAS